MVEKTKTITPPGCVHCGTPLKKHKDKDYYCCSNWRPNNAGCEGDIWYPPGLRKKRYPSIFITYKSESKSHPGHFHHVKIYESGDMSCPCVAGEMQRFCRHKKMAIEGIERLIVEVKKKNYHKPIKPKI